MVGERPQLSALSAAGALQGWRGRVSGFPSGRVGCVLSLPRISAFGAALRIRRYASATARGRRSRAGDAAVSSASLRPCFREPEALPRFRPLRQPARQGAESPILPPRFSQPLVSSRPLRPRGYSNEDAPAFFARWLPLCPTSLALGLRRLGVALARHLTSPLPATARRHDRQTHPTAYDVGVHAP